MVSIAMHQIEYIYLVSEPVILTNNWWVRMIFFQLVTQANSEKEISSSPNRSRTYDLPITSSDALPLSYRRLVGDKAIKLGSWDKHPAYC